MTLKIIRVDQVKYAKEIAEIVEKIKDTRAKMTKKKRHRADNLTTKDAIDDALVDLETMTSSVFMTTQEAITFIEAVQFKLALRLTELRQKLPSENISP